MLKTIELVENIQAQEYYALGILFLKMKYLLADSDITEKLLIDYLNRLV
jgi:hypothetical protein